MKRLIPTAVAVPAKGAYLPAMRSEGSTQRQVIVPVGYYYLTLGEAVQEARRRIARVWPEVEVVE